MDHIINELTNKQHNFLNFIQYFKKDLLVLLRQSLNVQVLLAAFFGAKSNA